MLAPFLQNDDPAIPLVILCSGFRARVLLEKVMQNATFVVFVGWGGCRPAGLMHPGDQTPNPAVKTVCVMLTVAVDRHFSGQEVRLHGSGSGFFTMDKILLKYRQKIIHQPVNN
jgi:hypothetical protein